MQQVAFSPYQQNFVSGFTATHSMDSVILRSYVNTQRCEPPFVVCEYPSNEELSQGWLDSNAAYRNMLLTCEAISHDALVSYISKSTLSISICQLAKAPPRSQYLLHDRHIEIGETLDRHLGKRNMKEAVSTLQRFSGGEKRSMLST